MKILFVGEDIYRSKGGIVTVMKQILSHDYLTHKVQFIPVFVSGDGFGTIEKIVAWMKAIIKYILFLPSADIVHLHHASDLNFFLTSYLAKIARLFNKRVLLHNHAADFKEFYQSTGIKKRKRIIKTFQKSDAIIVLSKSWYNWYSNLCPKANWILFPNAIKVERLNKEKKSTDQLTFLYLGRVEERKGIFDILEVLPAISKELHNFKLIIAGNGKIDRVKKLSKEKKIERNIEILGYVNEKQRTKILKNSDIFILPSYNEGLPMSLLEAMAYGVAPIVSKAGGIPDVIESGKNGMLINAGNLDELRGAILSLALNKEYRKYLAQNAYLTVLNSYNIDNYCKNLFSLYRDLYAKD